ncbi:MAG TPA: hypothetical protein VGK02_03105 [Candidatus Aquicultor sp.]|jgi:hypothetical protein
MGVSIIAMWALSFVSGQVPEVRTAPIALAFHLAAEFLTAIAILVSAIRLFGSRRWGIHKNVYGSHGDALLHPHSQPRILRPAGNIGLVIMFAAFLAIVLVLTCIVLLSEDI